MNNKGFTMIELLAIITVLATILLVSFPTLVNMTRRDKENQYTDMISTICKAGETYIYDNQELYPELSTSGSNINIELDDLINDKLIEKNQINPKTKNNLFGRLEYTVQSDKSLKCNFNPSLCTLVSDSDEDGEISPGDKYICRIKKGIIYNFYVLSKENDKVNLIMDRNICNDGSITYTEANNYCRYEWHTGVDDNNYGPDTAMVNLYNATKGWSNVPDMIVNYQDESNGGETAKGYTSIITNTSTKVTTITGKENKTSDNQTFGNITQPLKARLPKESEVTAADCDEPVGSCPAWLTENMTYSNVSNDKYSMNNNSEAYQDKIRGFWLLSSYQGDSSRVRIVYFYGGVTFHKPTYDSIGVRPVITVNVTDLSN